MAIRWAFVGLLLLAATPPARARFWERWLGNRFELDRINRRLHGHIVDYSANHDRDRRIHSAALGEKRDLYVYLPPNYDPALSYPLAFFFHGFTHDECSFLHFVEIFDSMIGCGKAPPMIIAVPDGSLNGRATIRNGGSFYVNSKAGNFEDYIMRDVWDFMHRKYPIRAEREAHVLIGGSMGGYAAYHLGIRHRERVGVIAAIFPPLNLRYLDCHGRYFANFDPTCLGWREQLRPFAPVGRFAFGLVTIRERRMTGPLFGNDPKAIDTVAAHNPVEMLFNYDVQPGEFEMFVGYVGRDAFNIDAQVDSFLYFARGKGLKVSSTFLPDGRHNTEGGKQLLPSLLTWLMPRVGPYSPPVIPR